MESNTVIIGTEEYNRLRDFYDSHANSIIYSTDEYNRRRIITKEEALQIIGDENKELLKNNKILKHDLINQRENLIGKFFKLSVRNFRKFKKTRNIPNEL